MNAHDRTISLCVVADETLEPEIAALTRSMSDLTIEAKYSLRNDLNDKATLERVFRSIHKASALPMPAPPIMRRGDLQRMMEAAATRLSGSHGGTAQL